MSNLLNNNYINTTGVCIIDDDQFIVDLHDLEFGLNVWRVRSSPFLPNS